MSLSKEVRVFRSVCEIGKETIDSLSEDPFFTFGWLRTVETQRSFSMAPIYVGVQEDNKLEALVPCFFDLPDHFFIDGPKIMPFMKRFLTLGQKFGYCQSHVLLCYSPFSLRSKILLKKDPYGKLILGLISKKIDDICREKRFLFSSFLFVSEFDKILINNLNTLGYSKFDGTTTFYLDIQWSSFEDYLKSLKQMNRHSIRREIRKCAENGVTIKETDLKDLSEEMSNLVSNLISKYNKNSGNPFDISFFNKLNQYAGDKILLFIAEKNGDIIGFSLCLRQRDALDVWMCGFNYDVQTSTDFTYFNLCYYAPIQWSIKEGIKKIYYRRKSERAKLYRGCKLESTYSFIKCHDVILSFWINKVLRNSIYASKLKPSSNIHK
jgi:predicted N-acyltransferase